MKRGLLVSVLLSMCMVWGIQSTGFAVNGQSEPRADRGTVESFRVGEIIGKTAINEQGQVLGTVEDVIATERGRIGYVILSVDGALGLTERWTPVPWNAADVQVQRDRVMMGRISRNELENAPSFSKGNLPDFMRPQVQQRINSYYRIDQFPERERYDRRYPSEDRYERRYPSGDRYERYPYDDRRYEGRYPSDDRYERYPYDDRYERRYPSEGRYERFGDDEARFGEYRSERIGDGASPYDGRRYPPYEEEETGIFEDIF